MSDPHNLDYGVSRLYALRAYFTNALNFSGQSTRSEYWWLLPWFWLFELASVGVLGSKLWPQLTLRALLLLPTAAICARRYRDAGFAPAIGIGQTIFAYSTWWALAAFDVGKLGDTMIWVWLTTLMPTQAATAVVNRSQAIAAFRTQHHLSGDELKLFHDTMSTAKAQILTLGTCADSSPKLAQVLRVSGGLHAAQELFRELMAHPHALTTHGDFLYKMLPEIVAASTQLITAEQADVANAQVNQAITAMLAGIQNQAQAISDEYARVVQRDAEAVNAHG